MTKINNKSNERMKHYQGNIYYGEANKIHYIVKYDNQTSMYSIGFNITIDEKTIQTLTKEIKKLNNEVIVKYKNSVLSLDGPCTNKKYLLEIINPLLDECTTLLKDGAKEVCKHCKKHKKVFLVDNDGEINYLCDDCFSEYITEAEIKEKNSKKIKQRTLLGIVGACIGIIPGMLTWFFLGYLNIETGLAGIIIAIGAALGFKKMSRTFKLSGIFITTLISIAAILISHELNCSFYIYNLFKQNYLINIVDAFKSIPYYLKTIPDFKKMFYEDLITGYVLSLVGMFSAYSFYRQSIYTYNIKKIGDKNEK